VPKLERLRSARRPRRGPPVRVDAQSVPERRKTPPEAERIPVDAVEFGTSAIRRLLERFGQATALATEA